MTLPFAVPRWVWGVLAGVVLFGVGWFWHQDQVAGVIHAAKQEQAAADTAAVRIASDLALAERTKLNNRIAAQDAALARRTADDYAKARTAVAADAAVRGKLWRARRADPGGAQAGAVPGTPSAAAVAADAACAAGGGLSFELALAALTDAEDDAAKLRALQAWAIEISQSRRE